MEDTQGGSLTHGEKDQKSKGKYKLPMIIEFYVLRIRANGGVRVYTRCLSVFSSFPSPILIIILLGWINQSKSIRRSLVARAGSTFSFSSLFDCGQTGHACLSVVRRTLRGNSASFTSRHIISQQNQIVPPHQFHFKWYKTTGNHHNIRIKIVVTPFFVRRMNWFSRSTFIGTESIDSTDRMSHLSNPQAQRTL